ncbi:hypothetical protein MTO96_022845 [Rhipicephalus appendiculatus]
METTPHEVPRNRGASPPPRLAPARPPPLQRSQLISPPLTRKSQTTMRLSMALSRRVRVNPLLPLTLTNSAMLLQPHRMTRQPPPPPLKPPWRTDRGCSDSSGQQEHPTSPYSHWDKRPSSQPAPR